MITKKDIKMIKKETKKAKTIDDWKSTVNKLYAVYGQDAIYHLCCDIFWTADDTAVDSIPYVNPNFRFGIAIRHTKLHASKDDYTEDESILFE